MVQFPETGKRFAGKGEDGENQGFCFAQVV